MYFFTPLQMIRSNGTRVKRNTKHGFWRATQKCTNILDSRENIIDVKMPLAYYSMSQNSTQLVVNRIKYLLFYVYH